MTSLMESANPPVLPTASNRGRRVARFALLLLLLTPPLFYGNDELRCEQFSKFAALGIFALSIDLIWGYTGLLSLGHGLFFGLGAYTMGYSLKLQRAALLAGREFIAAPDMALPDFMAYSRLAEVPVWIRPLIDINLALFLAIALPTLAAALFGFVTFRLRIKGVYFSIITQALILAMYLIVIRNQPQTGGEVGMTYLNRLTLFGYQFPNSFQLYYFIAPILILCYLGCALLTDSKFGQVLTAIRDNENRVMALGYNPALYKAFIFSLSGALAGLAGALYVAANRSIGPDVLRIDFSIVAVVWVAVGGRGTLIGAMIGVYLVEFSGTVINEDWPRLWKIIQGALFIGVVVFLPDGIVGLLHKTYAYFQAQMGWAPSHD